VKPGADIDGVNLLCVINATRCRGNQMDGHPYLYWRSGMQLFNLLICVPSLIR
jgi:hypothetical protein